MPAAKSVTVTTSATSLAAKNTDRVWITLDNRSAVDVFLGMDNTVDSTNGIALAAKDKLIESFDGDKTRFFYRGAWFAAVATGTADVRVLEITDDDY